MDLFITPIQFGASSGDAVIYSFWNAGVYVGYNFLFLDMSHTATVASRKADVVASYTAYATTNSYTISRVLGLELLSADPGSHIADAATNNPTNLNVVTTLLGAVTGQLNTSNANLNDLATKYNTLLNVLEDHGILLP